jgi:hypothetical protein
LRILPRKPSPDTRGLSLGLEELPERTAELLSKHQGTLALNCLFEISDGVAKALSKHQGKLQFDILEEISSKGAGFLHGHGNVETSIDLEQIANCRDDEED